MVDIFKNAAETPFRKENALKESYTPERLVGRENELQQLATVVIPILNGDEAANTFLFGPSGVGKTATTQYVINQLNQKLDELDMDEEVHLLCLNCEPFGGATSLMLHIVNSFREPEEHVPTTGYSYDHAKELMFQTLGKLDGHLVLFLDELDTLKNVADFLYLMTRPSETSGVDRYTNGELVSTKLDIKMSFIGVSNDPSYLDDMPPKVKSSLSNKETIFYSVYDANDLREVLLDRVTVAFKDTEIVESVSERTGEVSREVDSEYLTNDAVSFAASQAAKLHDGDARMALTILHRAGRIAWRDCDCDYPVDVNHVRMALDQLEEEWLNDSVRTLSETGKNLLYSLADVSLEHGHEPYRTQEIRQRYESLLNDTMYEPVGVRQVRNQLETICSLALTDMNSFEGGEKGTYSEHVLTCDPEDVIAALSSHINSLGIETQRVSPLLNGHAD